MLALLRPAHDQHVVIQPRDDLASQFTEILHRPELGRPICPAGIQRDDASVAAQPEPLEHGIRRALVGLDGG